MLVECRPFWPFLPEYQTMDEWEAMKAEKPDAAVVTMTYAEYLQTPHWIEIRAMAIERDGHRCRLCSATEYLQVHHNTYDNLWDEDPLDLITLCESCHGAVS